MTTFPKSMLNEMPPPPGVETDAQAAEVLRAWIANKGLVVSMSPLAFGGPETWGVLLVDVARHVARAYEQEKADTYEGAMRKIRRLFDKEWDVPTDMGTTHSMKKQ